MRFSSSASVSVFHARHIVAVSIGPGDKAGLVFERQGVGLADVHLVLLGLQILVIAFVLFIVFSLAVVRGRVAGEGWRWWHGGWSGVTETGGLKVLK